MGNGAWVSIVGIGFLLFVLWMVANAPKVDAALIEAKGAARVEAMSLPAPKRSPWSGMANLRMAHRCLWHDWPYRRFQHGHVGRDLL